MVVTGLFAGVRGSAYNEGERYKWGWYTISCIAFVLIFYILVQGGRTGKCLSNSEETQADP
jgi:bacteriorhodopsin